MIAEFDKQHYINIRSTPLGSMIGLLDIEGSGWHKENTLIELNTDEILVVIEDESRYRFDKWSGSIESNDRNLELLVDGPKLIYADYILQYKITKIIEQYDLCDIFRVRFPENKRFSFRQSTPRRLRRLDFFLISNSLQESAKKNEILTSLSKI